VLGSPNEHPDKTSKTSGLIKQLKRVNVESSWPFVRKDTAERSHYIKTSGRILQSVEEERSNRAAKIEQASMWNIK